MVEEPLPGINEFVELELYFGLHKSISGICKLHKKWGVA